MHKVGQGGTRSFVVIAAVLASSILLWPLEGATQSSRGSSVGIVTTISGEATVLRADRPSQPVTLKFKDEVFFKDRISTKEHSVARVLLGGKSLVTVRELSELTITEQPGRPSILDVFGGKIALAVAKLRMRPGETIEVRTPNAVAAVRGTVLVVEVITASENGEAKPRKAAFTPATTPVQSNNIQATFYNISTSPDSFVDVMPLTGRTQAPTPIALSPGQFVTANIFGLGQPQTIPPGMYSQILSGLKGAPQVKGPPETTTQQIAQAQQSQALVLTDAIAPPPAPPQQTNVVISTTTGTTTPSSMVIPGPPPIIGGPGVTFNSALARQTGFAASLSHDYPLNGSFADVLGGPALAPAGGTLNPTNYSFGANQGLTLGNGLVTNANYSIETTFNFSTLSGFRKIIDFKDRASDNGLYNLSTALNFFNVATGSAGAFSTGVNAHVLLTRDASTSQIIGYVNGVQQISFTDTGSLGVFSGPNNIIHFFIDDLAVGGEASAGVVDRIRIYDGPLTVADAIALFLNNLGPGDLSVPGDLVRVPAGVSFVASSPDSWVSINGGTHSIATGSGSAMFNLAGVNTTTADPDLPGSPIGTDQPLQGPVSLLTTSGATVSTNQFVKLDTALLDATVPLLNMLNGSSMVSNNDLVNLANRAKMTANLVPGDALVKLNANSLTVNNGSLFNVSNSSILNLTGSLASLANASALNILNGGLLSALGGSVVNITGPLVLFSGVGNSVTVNSGFGITNTINGISFFQGPGATVTIQGTASRSGGSGAGTFSGSGPLIIAQGAGTRVTVR